MTALLPHQPYQDLTRPMSWPHIMAGLHPPCELKKKAHTLLWPHDTHSHDWKTLKSPCHDHMAPMTCSHNTPGLHPSRHQSWSHETNKGHIMTVWPPYHDCAALISWPYGTHITIAVHLYHDCTALITWHNSIHFMTPWNQYPYHDPTAWIPRLHHTISWLHCGTSTMTMLYTYLWPQST